MFQKDCAIAIIQLVDDERRNNHRRIGREPGLRRMRAAHIEAKPERLVGEFRFLERPGMRVEAQHAERWRGPGRDRCAGDAGAAAEVDDGAGRKRGADLLDDVIDEQEVQRPVIEGEGGALPAPSSAL